MVEHGAVVVSLPNQTASSPSALPDHLTSSRELLQTTDRFARLVCNLMAVERAEFAFHEEPGPPARPGWLNIPIFIQGRHLGMAYYWREQPFRSDEIDRMHALTPLAAGALEILESSSTATESRTRLYVASQLHQGPAQRIAQAQMHLHLLRRSQHDPNLREGLRRLQGLIDGAARSLRDQIADLRLPPRSVFHLGTALEAIAAQLRAGGLRVDLDLEGEGLLSGPTAEVLAHTAAEAMINARKHANAQLITVQLRTSEAVAVLEVSDDGRGLPDNGARGGRGRQSFGLALMDSQIQGLGGIFEIRPRQEGGTVVRATVPLR